MTYNNILLHIWFTTFMICFVWCEYVKILLWLFEVVARKRWEENKKNHNTFSFFSYFFDLFFLLLYFFVFTLTHKKLFINIYFSYAECDVLILVWKKANRIENENLIVIWKIENVLCDLNWNIFLMRKHDALVLLVPFFSTFLMLSFPFWSKQVHKILCGNTPLFQPKPWKLKHRSSVWNEQTKKPAMEHGQMFSMEWCQEKKEQPYTKDTFQTRWSTFYLLHNAFLVLCMNFSTFGNFRHWLRLYLEL